MCKWAHLGLLKLNWKCMLCLFPPLSQPGATQPSMWHLHPALEHILTRPLECVCACVLHVDVCYRLCMMRNVHMVCGCGQMQRVTFPAVDRERPTVLSIPLSVGHLLCPHQPRPPFEHPSASESQSVIMTQRLKPTKLAVLIDHSHGWWVFEQPLFACA